MLGAHGRQITDDQSIFDHDTTLVGWPWAAGTYSWIEPTAYAIMALRATGNNGHPRVREAVRLVLDRALPDGGWNYGNRSVFGKKLRAFPATTGIALTALAGEPADPSVPAALEYLESELHRVRAPLSIAWGLTGMRAWNAMPAQAESWLQRAAQRLSERPTSPHYVAVLLLAGAEHNPLLGVSETQAHG